MVDHSAGATHPLSAAAPSPPLKARVRQALIGMGVRLLSGLLGAADGTAVATMGARELALILRSRQWHRFLGMWVVFCAAVLTMPILYRFNTANWARPSGLDWYLICGYTLQISTTLAMINWTTGRLRSDLHSSRLDELLMTRCSPADIALGEALASAAASVWLVATCLPFCFLLSALAGVGPDAGLRLTISLLPAGVLGVWFGMGWALAFSLRWTSATVAPLTDWWMKGPQALVWFAWGVLVCYPIGWAVLSFFPGGLALVNRGEALFRWFMLQVWMHLNPLLMVPGTVGLGGTTWVLDRLVMVTWLAFMMRKSMDAVNAALASLPERTRRIADGDAWIHHDYHYFIQYREGGRRQPKYRDNGNPIAAFDVSLGHRVYLHPFAWTGVIMIYAFLVVWSLLAPHLGKGTAIVAVLIPATGALLLMSGGVAISFGWERDQHRWPSLAVLPMSDRSLAHGKIRAVWKSTLWIGIAAALTALLLGWRGALEMGPATWMAVHVVLFPVALAYVTACLALTTPSLGEALWRWAVLGAIPAVAFWLPEPIGGDGGVMLPFAPPLLVLVLVLKGATPELIRGAWISLGLEAVGIAASLFILNRYLRQWTVGEKD